MLVTEIMTPNVVSVTTATPLNEVARVMSSQRVSGLPVVDPETSELVGIITELDMVERQEDLDLPLFYRFLDGTFVVEERDAEEKLRRILATTAGELMEHTVYSIREDASVIEVANLMIAQKVSPVPVVSFANEVIGIVSRSDIVRLMARDFSEPGGWDEDGDGVDDPQSEPLTQEPVADEPAETAPVGDTHAAGYHLVGASDDFVDDVPDNRDRARPDQHE
ncbi:MAG TPA: CBS domain-containing protein [Thermomicrobiales bacterium]|jgi:CBS domain-containing protein|nr:CBS domain-containing protein [Thermomicrobiales bacterium]